MAAGDYATLAEVRAVGSDVIKGVTYDPLLTALIPRASRLIDRYMRREDSAYDAPAVATTRQFDGNNQAELFIDECIAVTLVEYLSAEVTWTAWVPADYQTLGHDGTPNTLPICSLKCDLYGDYAIFPQGDYNIRVTANWGRSAAPPDVVTQACIAQVLYMFKRGQQAFQDQGGISELGTIAFVQGICKDAIDLLNQLPKKIRL